MAGNVKKGSKNNPNNRKEVKSKIVTSTTCEECTDKCIKGIEYLKLFAVRKEGRGVCCTKIK
jgi:hypothetical protein